MLRSVALLALGLALSGCALHPKAAPATWQRYEFEQPQMGVPFRIVLYAPDSMTAEQAARGAFARVAELNGIMSDYEFDSELSRLSRSSGSGRAIRLSPDLWIVLQRAQDLAQKSGGAFDVTVGPCVFLWRKARRDRTFPRADLLAEARSRVGYTNLVLDAGTRTAKLLQEGMRLDLGAIAKGYAADAALQTLRGFGIHSAMVAASGDIALGETPPGRRGWQIALLDGNGQPNGPRLGLRRAAVATSGDLFQYLEVDGKRYSHILDPRTCVGLTDRSLVTVIARDGLTADSLSTAVSILGPERGLTLVRGTRRASARILHPAGTGWDQYTSPNFPRP